MHEQQDTDAPIIYESHNTNASYAIAMIATAIVVMLALIALAALSIMNVLGSFNAGIIGGLSVMPIFLFVSGVSKLSAQRQLIIDDHQLTIVRARARKNILWASITSVIVAKDNSISAQQSGKAKKGSAEHRHLTLFNEHNKRIELIRSINFDQFDELVDDIEHYSSIASGVSTRDVSVESSVALKKARRTGVFMILFAIFMLTAAVFIAYTTVIDDRNEKDFASSGQIILADITDHRMHNGIAPRIEYAFTDTSGQIQENDVMLQQWRWDQLRGATQVEVIYLPHNPKVHRVAQGQDRSDSFSLKGGLMLSAIGAVMAIVFLIVGSTQFYGYDIKFDNTKLKLVPLGQQPKPSN